LIPKTIHYCWFGRGEKPKIVVKCMKSWTKYLPDYEQKEWNEDNFDVNFSPFVRQAYEDKNYAFVSDVARAQVLFNYGGIYFDTDVEVRKSFDRFLGESFFAGFEEGGFVGTCVIGAEKGVSILKDYLDYYASISYILEDGRKYKNTNVVVITELLQKSGIERNNMLQRTQGLTVYPRTYFSPYDYINGESFITEDSYAIHHFAQLWLPFRVRAKTALKKIIIRIIGPQRMKALRAKL
jgi:mannosyltransferase OCH1-like enzyme